MIAPTGVTVFDINETTIHSDLNISCHSKLRPLSDQNCVELRNKYSEAQIVITDEISMVSGILLYKIDKRLNETSKFEWTLNDRIEKIILVPVLAKKKIFFEEVSALLDVRHCPKLQSCAISKETNDATWRKWQKP